MIQLRGLPVAIMMISVVLARPVSAQVRDGSHSLTHVVSVTVPARVKVKVSSIAMTPSRSVPAAVRVAAASNGLALSVDANQAWVLSASASVDSARASKLQWSGTQAGQLTVDPSVFVGRGKSGSSTASAQPVFLTVSAP